MLNYFLNIIKIIDLINGKLSARILKFSFDNRVKTSLMLGSNEKELHSGGLDMYCYHVELGNVYKLVRTSLFSITLPF